jgi:hypothetical protein
MSGTIPDPRPGETFEVEYRVVGHSNEAKSYYYTESVEYFAFEEDEHGNLLLLLTEECRSNLRETIEARVEYLKIDPDNPLAHPYVESFRKQ